MLKHILCTSTEKFVHEHVGIKYDRYEAPYVKIKGESDADRPMRQYL